MMKWNHLPAPGGYYQQRPALLDKFLLIARVEGEVEKERASKERRKAEQGRRKHRMR